MGVRIEHIHQPGAFYRAQQQLLTLLYSEAERTIKKTAAVNETYFVSGLVAYNEGQPAGCCCLYFNPHIRHDDAAVLLVGNYELQDDATVATALISAAMKKAIELHCSYIIGPVNGSTWDDYRFATTPQDDVFFTEPLQKDYYPALFSGCGFTMLHRYLSSVATVSRAATDDFNNVVAKIRMADVGKFEEELADVYELCSVAFSSNSLYSPISREEFINKYLPVRPLVKPYNILLAEDADGAIIAFLFSIPDMYCPGRLVLKTVARHPAKATKGIVSKMAAMLFRLAAQDGCTTVIHAFMHEDNRSVLRSQDFGGEPFREYGVFIKTVTAGSI